MVAARGYFSNQTVRLRFRRYTIAKSMAKPRKKAVRTKHYGHNVRKTKNPSKKAGKRAAPVKKRKARSLPPYLTIPEKDRLFRVIQSPRDRAIFRVLYHHGLRASEIGKLEIGDYRPGSQLELDRIKITRLKGSISGECPVMPTAAKAVRAWIKVRGHKPGPLFPSRLGSPISRIRIFELMQEYCEQAGIPPEKAHPHALKHTCCTHLASDQRESIMDIRKHVGHAAIKSTMLYTDLLPEADEARAKRLRNWK